MKKKSMVIFGVLAALLAFSLVLTGCPDTSGGGGGDGGGSGDATWPAGFTHDSPSPGCWYKYEGGDMAFITGPLGSALVVWDDENPTYYGLKSKSGDVYTVQKITPNADGSVQSWDDSEWTFKAVLDADGLVITVSHSMQTSILANGDYQKTVE